MIVNTRTGKLTLNKTDQRRLGEARKLYQLIAKHGTPGEVEYAERVLKEASNLDIVMAGGVPVDTTKAPF